MMTRIAFIFCVLVCSGCFNESEPEILGCGVVDTGQTNVLAIETPHIFKAKCATCHHIEKDGTGPKLKGILSRVPSEEWLRSFITN